MDCQIYGIFIKICGIPINRMAEWSKALDYVSAWKWSWLKIRENHQGVLFFKFYFKDFKHLTMHEGFP